MLFFFFCLNKKTLHIQKRLYKEKRGDGMNRKIIYLIIFFITILIGTYLYMTNILIQTIDHVKHEQVPIQLQKYLEVGTRGKGSKYVTEDVWYDSYLKSYVENGKTYVLVRTISGQGGTFLDIVKKVDKGDILKIYFQHKTQGEGGLSVEPMNTLLIIDGKYKDVLGFKETKEKEYTQSKDYDILYDAVQKEKSQ